MQVCTSTDTAMNKHEHKIYAYYYNYVTKILESQKYKYVLHMCDYKIRPLMSNTCLMLHSATRDCIDSDYLYDPEFLYMYAAYMALSDSTSFNHSLWSEEE